jgi:hypothetical protein
LVYSGRWERKLDGWGRSFIRSANSGSSVSFTFFGKSISVWGYWGGHGGANVSVSIDDATPTLRSYEDQNQGSFYTVYESDDIGGATELEDQTPKPHTIVVKITAVSIGSSLQLGGFMYSPSFTSLEEGEKLRSIYHITDAASAHHPASHLSAGIIAGIAVGACSLVVIVLCISVCRYRRRKHRDRILESTDGAQMEQVRDGTDVSPGFSRPKTVLAGELAVPNPKLYLDSDPDSVVLPNTGEILVFYRS